MQPAVAYLDTEYITSLEHFLSHSDEDLQDSRAFVAGLMSRFQARSWKPAFSVLSWLDVGVGPGYKPILIIRDEAPPASVSDIRLDVIEPSAKWVPRFLDNVATAGLEKCLGTLFAMTWEDFIRRVRPFERGRYDIITFFHSVYGIDPDSLRQLSSFLAPDGLACFCVESPESDLHRIKRRFFPKIHAQKPVSANDITAILKRSRSLLIEESPDVPQKYYVDDLLGGDTSGLLFALQLTPEQYASVFSNGLRDHVVSYLQDLVKSDAAGQYIEVPDRLIWAKLRND